MRIARLRLGELMVLVGVIGVVVALTLPWYENLEGKLDAWDTFGFGVFLLVLAAAVGLVLVLATLTERSTALPVAAAVWGTFFGLLGVLAAIVRVLERPDHAYMLCAGAWVALGGAVLILGGSWQSIRDERTNRYPPASPEPRDPPGGDSRQT
jgi:hypothetical protein